MIRLKLAGWCAGAALLLPAVSLAQAPRFEVSIAPSAHAQPLTGRLVLVLAKTDKPEPRAQMSPQGPAVFGVDLEQLPAGQTVAVTSDAVGFPTSLSELPA